MKMGREVLQSWKSLNTLVSFLETCLTRNIPSLLKTGLLVLMTYLDGIIGLLSCKFMVISKVENNYNVN